MAPCVVIGERAAELSLASTGDNGVPKVLRRSTGGEGSVREEEHRVNASNNYSVAGPGENNTLCVGAHQICLDTGEDLSLFRQKVSVTAAELSAHAE